MLERLKKIDRKQCLKIFHYAIRYIAIPILLVLIIESLNRKSVIAGVRYLFERPSLFLFNSLIIMLSVSIALFFKRELFVYVTISLIWLIFGIVNFIILHIRVTPFSAVDITLLQSAISVSGHYLTPLNIAMIILAVVMVLAGLIILYRKSPYRQHTTHKRIFVSITLMLCFSASLLFLRKSSNSVQALSKNYTNISEAYENYGFVYCFANSIIDTGITKPENYSEEKMDKIMEKLDSDEKKESVKPNIIFIQLESFFDVDTIKDLELSRDAIPNFHLLQKQYSNGLLTVPTVGAGTVNTEFEVLTGMRQRHFGTSEYPYKTILRDKAVESICYDLKELGYTTHCVHNNEATFYGRNKVFANLGFDTFTSMEYMNGLEDNPNGWKKDRILSGVIANTLDATSGPDFTMGITVQSHGKYEGIDVIEDAPIKVLSAPDGMEDSYRYYVNQLYEVDKMIGDLVRILKWRNEKTILVLYGDHLPSLNIEKEDLEDTNLYQTQYVIWDNFNLPKKEKDLSSYQLYSEVLRYINIKTGIITRYHQNTPWDSKQYNKNLKLLEYDMLYGENYVYGGESPYEPTNLQMGIEPVTITDVKLTEKGYEMTGKGFTPYSHVRFADKELSIVWEDSRHILITDDLESEEEEAESDTKERAFVVEIRSDGGSVLSESEPFQWEETSLKNDIQAGKGEQLQLY